MVQGLQGGAGKGDGYIRIFDLFEYVSGAVRNKQPKQEPIFEGRQIDSNFPLALDQGGRKGATSSTGDANGEVSAKPLIEIRMKLVDHTDKGLDLLKQHIVTLPEEILEAAEVDPAVVLTQIGLVKRYQAQMNAFGPNPSDNAARAMVIADLIRACLRLEKAE
jgi:hypothetical protein